MRRLALAAFALALCAPARAGDAAPADTLMDMRRALGSCLSATPLGEGSQVTIAFMLRRDGSVFGKPRIRYARLEGDADAQRRFLGAAERAVDSCLPLAVTPALGAAIAGRMFSITLGRPAPRA